MAEVDTSFYPKFQQTNPFDSMSQMVGIANAIQTNKLLQGQQVQQQVGIDTNRLSLAVQQLGQLRGMFAPHLNNPNVSVNDVTQIATDALQHKLATPQQVATELATFPKNGTSAQRMAWVRDRYVRSLAHEQQIQMQLGSINPYSTGGGTTFVQQPMRPDQPTMQRGAIPNTLTPGQQFYDESTRSTRIIPQGQPGQFQPGNGGGVSVVPRNAPGGGAMPQQPPMPPQRPGMPGQPQAGVPGGAKYQGQPTLAAGPPLGEGEAAKNVGAAAGNVYGADLASAANYQREIYPLVQSIEQLEKLGTRGTGPGTETINQLKSFALSNIPGANFEGVKNDVEAYDKAKKYLVQYVNESGVGAGTNDRLAAAFSGNPSTSISNAAAVDVAKSAYALRRLRQAQTLAFHDSGLPEAQYTRFGLDWNRKQDPRAYGLDMMKPEQRAKLLESLKGNDRARFMDSVRTAIKSGLIAPESLGGVGGR